MEIPIQRTGYRKSILSVFEYHFGVVGLLLADLVFAFIIIIAACWFSPSFRALPGLAHASDPGFSVLQIAAAYAVIFPLIAHVFGLHNPLARRQGTVLLVKYTAVTAIALTVLTIVFLFTTYTRIGRYILIYAFVFSAFGTTTFRIFLWKLSEEKKKRLLLVGAGRMGRLLADLVEKTILPYEVVGFTDVSDALIGTETCNRPILDGRVPVDEHCHKHNIHEVVTCVNVWARQNDEKEICGCMLSGVQVSTFISFIEKTFFYIPVEFINPSWFFQINTSGDYAIYRGLKRMADIMTALASLAITSPILLLSAILIKLESPGPVLYSQVRIGQYNRRFNIWKLRSMRSDAEKDGPQWASKGDQRVTRFGWLLRRTRVDEIPQFWNVLRGEMSVIGPRPERKEFVESLAVEIPFYEQRHLLKPGITGWAQINYPYGSSKEDALNKLKYDLYYVKNASVLLDLHILLRTVGSIMKGAR